MPGRVIAIDGPAASGKSSVSRGVSSALRFHFLSSGHLYRTLAWGVVRSGIAVENFGDWIKGHRMTVRAEGLEFRVFLDDEEATPHLSDPDVAAMVSKLATLPSVREIVNGIMRAQSLFSDLVIEGRDIGSVVFPETPWKFYLDASPEERARRRAKEGVVDSVAERDLLDSTRATAPLTIPQGATVIDTTHLDLQQVISAVLSHLKELTP
jgi:cytidylate kinase